MPVCGSGGKHLRLRDAIPFGSKRSGVPLRRVVAGAPLEGRRWSSMSSAYVGYADLGAAQSAL